MCLPGDQLSHSTSFHVPGGEGHSDTWKAAEGFATEIREDAGSSELSEGMHEALAPARNFRFDAETKNGNGIVTYDSTKVTADGDEVLTARIVIQDKDDDAFVEEVFVCTSETTTSLTAFQEASNEFYGPILEAVKTEEELVR